MLRSDHPDEELLSALASGEAEAAADVALADHVATCATCATAVREIGVLRASLADLPDLRPPRPLRLLPDVPRSPSDDRVGGLARRIFGPVLAAGAALALVGMVGTAAPAISGLDAASGAAPSAAAEAQVDNGGEVAGAQASQANRPATLESAGEGLHGYQSERAVAQVPTPRASPVENDTIDVARESFDGERSPWPMILFAGIALMIGAALLRWILVPRAG